MQLPEFRIEKVMKLLGIEEGEGRQLVRQICGADPAEASLGDMEVVALALYVFCTHLLQIPVLPALDLCRRVRRCEAFRDKLRESLRIFEEYSADANVLPTMVTIHERKYATWFGSNEWLVMQTSETVPKLPAPPLHYMAWDATVFMVRLIHIMEQGAKQDAKPTAACAGSTNGS